MEQQWEAPSGVRGTKGRGTVPRAWELGLHGGSRSHTGLGGIHRGDWAAAQDATLKQKERDRGR